MKIYVCVYPRKSEQKIIQEDDTHYVVWVLSQPIDGQANQEVIKVLAKYFHVPPSCVVLQKGGNGRYKMFEIVM